MSNTERLGDGVGVGDDDGVGGGVGGVARRSATT